MLLFLLSPAAMALDGKSVPVASVITEFALPKGVSAPQAIAVDGAGHVWFTEKVGKSLTMFDPEKKSYSVHALPASWGGVGPFRVVSGSGGDLWFSLRRWADSESEINLLGQFIPDRNVFRKHLLPKGIVPEDLAVDRDGIVWFLNPDQNRIHRFRPVDADLQGYLIPTDNGYPRGIALDDKNGLWFAEANINRIGRFDRVDHTFREYDIPTPFANPGGITVDGSGRIWFVELTANQIGVFYPKMERFDEVIIPTLNGLPNAIVADDQGHIWFLEYRGSKVGRFDPVQATFREFNIPTFNSLPGELAIDRKRGRLWFSETGTEARKLGMIAIADALAAPDPAVTPVGGTFRGVDGDSGGGDSLYLWLLSLVAAAAILLGVVYGHSRRRKAR